MVSAIGNLKIPRTRTYIVCEMSWFFWETRRSWIPVYVFVFFKLVFSFEYLLLNDNDISIHFEMKDDTFSVGSSVLVPLVLICLLESCSFVFIVNNLLLLPNLTIIDNNLITSVS